MPRNATLPPFCNACFRYARAILLGMGLGLLAMPLEAAEPESAGLPNQALTGAAAQQAIQRIVQTPSADTDPSGLHRSGYQAAQRFLRQQSLTATAAQALPALNDLPARDHSLMWLGKRGPMSAQQTDEVLDWVHRGGRLLLVAQALWNDTESQSGDALLDRLQLRLQLTARLPQLPDAPGDDYPQLTKLYLENETAPAYFSFDPGLHLEDPTNQVLSWANSSGATHLMQLAYGAGLITVVSDAALWTDSQIGRYNNAWLLWYLNQGTEVTVLLDAPPQSEWRRFQPFFPTLSALALLLLLGIWHVWPLDRQSLASLGGRLGCHLCPLDQHALLTTLRRDILHRACQHHPGFGQLPVAEQWQVLARLTHQPTRAISQALLPIGGRGLSRRAFTRQVAHLQTLRNAL